jgi:prepilin-type N-terminal cleavage/methylation domain-containing protein
MHKTVKKHRINIFRRQNQKAFTLPEVVVAAALLLIAIVPILQALTQANLNSRIIEIRTQSLCYAQAKLNQIKARSIYDFNDISESNSLGNSYFCNVSQTTVSSNLKVVTIEVSYRTPTSSEVEVTLQSQVAKRWP